MPSVLCHLPMAKQAFCSNIGTLCLPGSPAFCDPMPLICDLHHRLTLRVCLHTS